MNLHARLKTYLQNNPTAIGKVVDYNAGTDRLFPLDFTAANIELNMTIIADTQQFSDWVSEKLKVNNCRYGIGGYMEHRTIYAVSPHFDTDAEPRRLHLGVDIWGDAGTLVYSPFDGTVHSFQDNNNLGDYGPAIILKHNLDGLTLYSLYGHLSRKSLIGLTIGMPINKNQQIATLGNNQENGQWPPHLHFQLMYDMEGKHGDYPGVCKYSEKEQYGLNIPDPNLVLRF
ncbi:Peptidase family M23 [Mucilaginibacter lappiensis]|uniref:Murein DD-endopeptidase MepM/ murein hydrolase activator NlpD n=2 Tax=Mucilaginibacter lappiensis TaxID=354630 RepID=A0ABR6PKX0_9SPHI|nr:peptidoglycan DD-metalloendopeptidase family protein [Mucilaginibacter lappiensis]MBB6110419.1 murein DD-endopeptidase MepM/ murein hydrolase activator NlpD [Mucilaginibacter lappiensis]SIR33444.1 Peptidase family M23 [Mucilaginibacter lappiensis]